MNSVLVIAAHPDDEVLGCGGTIAKLSKTCQIHILVLTAGRIEGMRDRAKQANAVLRAETTILDFPDQQLDTVPLQTIAKSIDEMIAAYHPANVYTHSPCDLNQDHQAAAAARLIATRPVPGHPVKAVYTYEVNSATEWGFGQFRTFQPNVFMDITDTLDIKLKALACYDPEMRKYPHPRSTEAILYMAKYRGTAVGVAAAEAFALVRSLT